MSVRGFTLVEVLVALTVASVGMLALVGAAGQFTKQSAQLRDRTLAQWVADNRLAQLRIDRAFPETGTQSGASDLGGRRWVWHTLVSAAPGEADLRRVDVAVAHADRPDAPVVVVTGFLGRQ